MQPHDMLGQQHTLAEVMDYVCHDNYVLVGTTISVYLRNPYANQEVVRLLQAVCDAKIVLMAEYTAAIVEYETRQYAEQDF
jgi:putative N-acetylmannosamine-6-phosphate epimerase